MTNSLSDAAAQLISPSSLFRVHKIARDPKLVPREPGVYAWWFDRSIPIIDYSGTFELHDKHLLYVGISPNRLPNPGNKRPRNLRKRLSEHCRGPITSSTLRRALASLMHENFSELASRNARGKVTLEKVGEQLLTGWMDQHAAVSWIVHPQPWLIEKHVFSDTPRLPLNVQGSRDPFIKELKRLRSQLGKSI